MRRRRVVFQRLLLLLLLLQFRPLHLPGLCEGEYCFDWSSAALVGVVDDLGDAAAGRQDFADGLDGQADAVVVVLCSDSCLQLR